MSTPKASSPEPTANGVLLGHRQRRGWSRGRLVAEFERAGRELGLPIPDRDSLKKAIYRHETGRVRIPDDLYVKLYSTIYEAPAHELFSDFSNSDSATRECYALQSHKFIPAYIGPEAAAKLQTTLEGEHFSTTWTPGWRASIEHPHGICTLYGFPWGSLVYHLQEARELPHVADLAVWRHHSYQREVAWAREHLTSLVAEILSAPDYVLSAFWLETPKWDGPQLETAMRLLCTPRVLMDREVDDSTLERARLAEQAFLQDGYDNSRIVDFGTYGVSLGYASWAGVTYYPMTTRTALDPTTLIDLELVVQGLWCFCQHLRSQIEAGQDAHVEAEYGWRWLRGIRSRLTSAQPQETSQESSLRTAILQTSELETLLTSALEILRDAEREAGK
ncbi:hypothetical protein ABZS29_38555 [Kribbella sp. NPDC005582]|uniref:hypothetical protein n=1 Tax=Kribbella sp. NPDC005582 TaxID=3156893 RepID=UPI0033A57F87